MVTSVFALKSVKVFEEDVLVMVPDPEIVEIVSLFPFKSNVAPEATTRFATSLILALDPSLSAPAFTVIKGVVKLVVPEALPPQVLVVILKLPVPFLSKSPIVNALVVCPSLYPLELMVELLVLTVSLPGLDKFKVAGVLLLYPLLVLILPMIEMPLGPVMDT